jgi:hypothetical protein
LLGFIAEKEKSKFDDSSGKIKILRIIDSKIDIKMILKFDS